MQGLLSSERLKVNDMLITFNLCIGFASCSIGSDAGSPVTNFLYLRRPLISKFIKLQISNEKITKLHSGARTRTVEILVNPSVRQILVWL